MRFENGSGPPTIAENSATYLLFQQGDALRIVFQLDHQALMQRVQDLGLLPANGKSNRVGDDAINSVTR